MNYDIDTAAVQAVLMAVAVEGTALNESANAARQAGDDAAAGFGTAQEVAEAFTYFWRTREDVAQRVSSLVFRKADSVAEAAQAFVAANQEMTDSAHQALARINTDFAAPVPRHRPKTPVA